VRSTLLLARRYLAHHLLRSVTVVVAVALTLLLPFTVELLVSDFTRMLAARAQATPLVAGAPGSRYDLVLSSLYYQGRVPAPLSMETVEQLEATGLGDPVPILARNSARERPVVGTTFDYFERRGLTLAAGEWPALLGDCVLGARVAAELGLAPGDRLLSDQRNLYDISRAYPLRMRVMGVLAARDSPDDDAVFCDLKTAWLIEGLGHGHQSADEQQEGQVIGEQDGRIVLNSSVLEFTEVTPENVDGFHFHGSPAELPVTGVLIWPHDDKSRTLLRGRFHVDDSTQLLVPTEVVEELLGFVFRVKVFFDANTALVGLATALFLAAILALTLELRRREVSTLARIGCARGTVAGILATELALLLAGALVLALGLATLIRAFVSL